MSQAKATEFIEKLFSDDAFIEEAVRKAGGLKNAGKDNNEDFIQMGHATGYDFTDAEFTAAISDFAKGKGFAGFRRLLHVGRLMKKVDKRVKKGK